MGLKDRALIFLWLLLIGVLISSCPSVKVYAGWLGGDESVGGYGYLLDHAYSNKIPTGVYAEFYYQAYHKFHYEIPLTSADREVLERIVEAEATGGTLAQKMNVASCVLARVQSRNWPNTIKGVVFDNDGATWQFTPISDGRYYTVKITDSTRRAVEQISKEGLIHTCLFFCAKASYEKTGSWHKKTFGDYLFYDGMHCYFEED